MPKQIRAVFLDKASLFPGDLNFSVLEEVAHWQWLDNAKPADVLDDIADAQILVANKTPIKRDVIESSKHLKLICIAATGVNNVDLDAARDRYVRVCNVRAYATPSVVQHVFSLILALNQKLFSYKASVIDGDWSRSDYFCYFGSPVSGLEGKTLGIIGYGELGHAVAKVAECFGMKVLVAHGHGKGHGKSSQQGRVDITTLLSESDVVSLHCPLTESNHHMISVNEFSVMKNDAILINAARGGLVDEPALLQALKNGDIGAAALDVLDQEPPAVDNPLIKYSADNLIITPHIAWASRQSRQNLVNEIAENIKAYLKGEPRNLVI